MNSKIEVINNYDNLVSIRKSEYSTPDGRISVMSIDDSQLLGRLTEANYRISNMESNFLQLRTDYWKSLQDENETLKSEIKELRKNLAYLNTRVNNLIAEKQLAKVNK